MDWAENSWDMQLVLHSVSMRLEHQMGARTVLLGARSTRLGHSRGFPSHHTQLVEQENPGHSLSNLLDPRWTVIPAQGALYAL